MQIAKNPFRGGAMPWKGTDAPRAHWKGRGGMYTATRYFFTEGERTGSSSERFRSLNAAAAYAHEEACGPRFAGLRIEDGDGRVVYGVTLVPLGRQMDYLREAEG